MEGEPEDAIDEDRSKEQLKEQMREQAPDQGAIIGYAMATHHLAKEQGDVYIAPPGLRSAYSFPRPGKIARRGATTPSRSSVISRAA